MQNHNLSKEIKNYALSLGFDLVGFSKPYIEEKYLHAFDEWLQHGHQGEMAYMEKIEQRRDLQKILPGAKSVIVLAMNYYHDQEPLKPKHGRVARYAYGRDYHKIIRKKLKQIEAYLKTLDPTCESKAYVDTGPILERALAEQAGLGRIGKNALLITEEFGSWVFLSEIITTLDLTTEKPKLTAWNNAAAKSFNACGGCTRCITACPTGAIIAPGVIDSRLCISYLTIENKDKIPSALAKIIKKTKRLYGCDICQEVCPHNNKRQTTSSHQELSTPPLAGNQLSLKKLTALKTDQQFLQTFAGSPLMRAKRTGLQRNAKALS